MSSRRSSNFRPKWLASGSPFQAHNSEDLPGVGGAHYFIPRLPARLVPFNNGHSISAQTLSDALAVTQRIVTYVTYDVVRGPQPGFADLRSVGHEVESLSKLQVDPFDDGSFIIPARLQEETVKIETANGQKPFSGRDVLRRFVDVMRGVVEDQNFLTSIGLVQAIEDLGKIIRRESHQIEYYPTSDDEKTITRIVVDHDYVEAISRHRKHRESPIEQPDELEGRLTAVDISEGRLKLRIAPRVEVRGTFTPFMQERMVQYLNRRIRLSGTVTYKFSQPISIRAAIVEPLED